MRARLSGGKGLRWRRWSPGVEVALDTGIGVKSSLITPDILRYGMISPARLVDGPADYFVSGVMAAFAD